MAIKHFFYVIVISMLCITNAYSQTDTLILCQIKFLGCCFTKTNTSSTFAIIIESDNNNKHRAKYVQYKSDCPIYYKDFSDIPSVTPAMIEKRNEIIKKSHSEWTEEESAYTQSLVDLREFCNYREFFKEGKDKYNIIAPEKDLSDTDVKLVKSHCKMLDSIHQQQNPYVFKGEDNRLKFYVENGHFHKRYLNDLIYSLEFDLYETLKFYNYEINDSTLFRLDGLLLNLSTTKSLHISSYDLSMSFSEFDKNLIHIISNLSLILNDKKIRQKDKHKTLSAISQTDITSIKIEQAGKKRRLKIETK